MRIDEFEFQDRNGNEIEPTKNQLVIYIKSLHKQIAELKKQLEESEKMNKSLYNEKESAEKILRMSSNEQTREILELKQQLKSQPAEIVEKIKVRFLATCQIEQGNDEMIASFQTFNRCLDTILKEYMEEKQ